MGYLEPEEVAKYRKMYTLLGVGGGIFLFGFLLLVFGRTYGFDGSNYDLFMVFGIMFVLIGLGIAAYPLAVQIKLLFQGLNRKDEPQHGFGYMPPPSAAGQVMRNTQIFSSAPPSSFEGAQPQQPHPGAYQSQPPMMGYQPRYQPQRQAATYNPMQQPPQPHQFSSAAAAMYRASSGDQLAAGAAAAPMEKKPAAAASTHSQSSLNRPPPPQPPPSAAAAAAAAPPPAYHETYQHPPPSSHGGSRPQVSHSSDI